MHRRASRATAAAVSLALAVLLLPGTPASGQEPGRGPAKATLRADPHTVFDAQLPMAILFTASGFPADQDIRLTFADRLFGGTTNRDGVARVPAHLDDEVTCDGQDSLTFPAKAEWGGGDVRAEAHTRVVLVCPDYDVTVAFDPAATDAAADVDYRPEPDRPVSQDPDGLLPVERAPDVLACVTVADARGAVDATGAPIPAGSPVPPSFGAAETGRVSAVESQVLSSRSTPGTTSTTAAVPLRPHADDVCYEVEHSGAPSHRRGTASYRAILDLSVVEPEPDGGAGPADPRSVSAAPAALTVVDSRLITVDPACAPGGDPTGIVVSGTRWEPGDRVVVTADGEPVTGAPHDAVVGQDGTFAVDLGAYSPGPGTVVMSAVVRRWFREGDELVDVGAQTAQYRNPCEPAVLVATPEEVLFSSGQDPHVDILLTGFPPNTEFSLAGSPYDVGPVLDADGLPTPPVTDETGRFSGKVTVLEPSCAEQVETLTATTSTAEASDEVQLRCVRVAPPPATIDVSPSPAAFTAGERPFDVEGAGFAPGPVSLLLDGAPVGMAAAGSDGVLNAGFTRSELPCGDHVLRGVQPTRSAATLLTITCPQLVADPGLLHRAGPPAPMTLTGTGFDPTVPVRLVTELGTETTVTAGPDGGFAVQLPAESLPCGPSFVVAVETIDLPVPPTAQAPLEVRCATLTVTPSVAATGTTVLVQGTGFPEDAAVRLGWQLENLRSGLGTAVASTDGSGQFTSRFLIFAKDQVGPRSVVATTETGGGVSVTSAPVLAVPSSVQPGRPQGVEIARLALLGRR